MKHLKRTPQHTLKKTVQKHTHTQKPPKTDSPTLTRIVYKIWACVWTVNSNTKIKHISLVKTCVLTCVTFSQAKVSTRDRIFQHFFLAYFTFISACENVCAQYKRIVRKNRWCEWFFRVFRVIHLCCLFFALAYQCEKIYAALERRGLCPLKVSSNGKCYSCSLPAISFKQEPSRRTKKNGTQHIYALRVHTKWMAHFRQGST